MQSLLFPVFINCITLTYALGVLPSTFKRLNNRLIKNSILTHKSAVKKDEQKSY